MIPIDKLCHAYVNIREKKKQVVAEMEKLIAEYDEKLDAISAAIKEHMVESGVTSMRTTFGTAYVQQKNRYYAINKEAFNNWIVDNKAVDLLESRIHQGNMSQWLKENPKNPPIGMEVNSEITVIVRKS